MPSFISCKNREGEYETFKVPEEIKNYIIQLECYILDHKNSKLIEKYPERFKNNLIKKTNE